MTRRRFVQIDGELVEITADYIPETPPIHVIPDIQPFVANDGAQIRGRAQWREHLKATNGVEMGHSDIRAAEAFHAKRKSAHAERLAKSASVAAVDLPYSERQVYRRSNLAAEVLNRLHGRPMPDRKTVIKIALEEARRRR